MNVVRVKLSRTALRLCALAIACLGVATPSWAAQCEDAALACPPSALAPAALPDNPALREAHSRSANAHVQPPRVKRVPPQTEPSFRPELFHDPRTKKPRTPTISPFVPLQDHTVCDIEGFATKSGQALSDHIRAMTYRCFDALFSDAPPELRLAAFQMRNMIDIAQATVQLMATYEGVNTDHLYSKHYLFLRVGYYNLFGTDELDWSSGSARTVVAEAVIEAIDAFVDNDHFLDLTETHCETAWEIYAMMEGEDFGAYVARYLPAFKSWLRALGRDHVDLYEVVSATNGIVGVLDQAHLTPSFVAAATTDTDLVATLLDLALQDYMLGTTAELLLGNAGYALAQFVQYDAAPIYPDVVAGIRTILNHYDSEDGFGVWLEPARIVSYHGKCAEFDICGFEQELEAQILSVSHACSAVDVRIRAQDLTAQDLATACSSLANINDRFHALLNTGRTPVADDHNAHLEIVVYANWDNYDTYSGLFFGNDTDNGGIYYEGDPAAEDNEARFFVYVADWLPERRIWNLEHEYVHYLDGRFNLYGGFDDSHMQLWWAEGLAEYVSLGNANERAIEIAQGPVVLLNDLFPTTYDHGADRVYRWTYLAIRFLFEHHADHIGQITGYLRANCLDEYQDYLEGSIGNRHNDEWQGWLRTVVATSEFAADRGVRSYRFNCGIHSGGDSGSNVDTGSRTRSHVRQVEISPLGESTTVDVSAFFRGFGGDAVFSVTSADPNVVAATLDGNVLTLLAVSAGEVVVSMTANEGTRSVTRTLLVEVAEACAYCRSWTDGWRLQILLDSLKSPRD